jgi:hypothetical protein
MGMGSTGASSGGGSGTGSSSAGSTGTGGGAAAFVGTWNLSGTATFTNCTGGLEDVTGADSRVVTWTAGGPGLIGAGPSCTFLDTVSGETATLAPSEPQCTFSPSAGETVQNTFETFAWVLSADGTTATVSQAGAQTITQNGATGTCQLLITDTATRVPGPGAAAFVGTWNLSGTATFTNCTGGLENGMDADSRVITWTAGGTGLIGAGPSCTFLDTVSGETATLSPAEPQCTFSSSSGDTVQNTFETFAWVLSAAGTTATVSETETQTVSAPNGATGTCQLLITDTATRE